MLQAERLIGSEGEVEVDWEISGGGNVSAEFMPSQGTAVFQDVSHLRRGLWASMHVHMYLHVVVVSSTSVHNMHNVQ